ncbi:MAG TPA: UpxY family transcription antiterminator [bacterium (Candidatus Stahlbacteria)]|nr:UpxY family transcription antiterminator [Candidatus Stahlbacteria bacterium]
MAEGCLWFAAYTRPNCEALVAKQLDKKGIPFFLPRIPVRSRRNERLVYVEKPLFRSYVFAQSRTDPDSLIKVYRTYGLIYILGRNGKPEPVPDEDIDSIRIFVAQKPNEIRVYHHLVKGEKAVVASGPLKGAVGIIMERRDKKKELVISLELMKRSVAVTLAEDEVDPIC